MLVDALIAFGVGFTVSFTVTMLFFFLMAMWSD